MANQLGPVVAAAKARGHLQDSRHLDQQELVEHVGADAQHALRQPVLPVGQPQVLQTGVVAVAAHRLGLLLPHQPELALHQLHAAAHRALVHRESCPGPVLGAGQLQHIKNVEVLQGCGRGVAAVRPPRRGAGGAGVEGGHWRPNVAHRSLSAPALN